MLLILRALLFPVVLAMLGGCSSPRAATTVPTKILAPINVTGETEKPPPPVYTPKPGCTPRTCRSVRANCGTIEDGCGAVISCGPCEEQLICGGAGLPNVCGSQICVARTCHDLHLGCGHGFDGCGNVLDCGGCASGQLCGAQAPGQCGVR